MAATRIPLHEAGLPVFSPPPPSEAARGGTTAFSLSSHARAREALDFGLDASEAGFNVFVVGENRSGRMTATLAYLHERMKDHGRPDDWVYLNNFQHPHEPIAVRLPAGAGRRFRDAMATLIPDLRQALADAFTRQDYQTRIHTEKERLHARVGEAVEALRSEAMAKGLTILDSPQGLAVVPVDEKGEPRDPATLSASERTESDSAARAVRKRIDQINLEAVKRRAEFVERLREFNRQVVDAATSALLDDFIARMGAYPGLNRWLVHFRADVMDHWQTFRHVSEDKERTPATAPGEPYAATPEERYAVNLLVDNGEAEHPPVVLEANPTYANLFGRIEYRQVAGTLQTDFSLIQAGALHRANGGVLVLRAEAVAANPETWTALKGALRDGEIRIEEPYRAGGVAFAGSPRPHPVPLNVKVVLIGAPRWYYAFFSIDTDFQAHFKVKAEIDPDMAANEANLSCYAHMIREFTARHDKALASDAVAYLLRQAARLAEDREKLSARFELIEDVISEACHTAKDSDTLDRTALAAFLKARRNRNGRIEDRLQESIRRGTVMISTTGAVVGQINGLTVRDLGDHVFGTPARVTARTSIGRRGVTNIERETLLGGPIQQKGAMVIQGFLAGLFARRLPLSFNASITFEQSYGGVEGDSASLAELLAILSDLSGAPLRQDLAVTGSINQRGEVQAIGGLIHKAEGFFRTCREAGALNGAQGVVFPEANRLNLVADDDLITAMGDGGFQLWAVEDVDSALELLTDLPAGKPGPDGDYPPESVYGRIEARLKDYNRILSRQDREDGA